MSTGEGIVGETERPKLDPACPEPPEWRPARSLADVQRSGRVRLTGRPDTEGIFDGVPFSGDRSLELQIAGNHHHTYLSGRRGPASFEVAGKTTCEGRTR